MSTRSDAAANFGFTILGIIRAVRRRQARTALEKDAAFEDGATSGTMNLSDCIELTDKISTSLTTEKDIRRLRRRQSSYERGAALLAILLTLVALIGGCQPGEYSKQSLI